MSDLPRIESLLAEALALIRNPLVEVASPAVIAPPAPVVVSGAFPDGGGKFYDFLRDNALLGPKISGSEFQGCEAIIGACFKAGWPISYTAYAMGTAYLETNHTMQPIKEMGGPSYYTRMYDIRGNRPAKAKELGNLTPGDGARYPGRGYPQLTGRNNYVKATKAIRAVGINVDLVANPELAMRPDIAAVVMIAGMGEGWFTGRKLSNYLPASGPAAFANFVPCRSIINGHDREEDVAHYAIDFQAGLEEGGYHVA